MSTEQIIVNDVAIQTSVAPIEVPLVEVPVKQTKEKKPKKVSDTPKLAPRFQKFIDFGFWVALQLKNKNLINDEVFQTILTDIKMNDQVEVQTDFYTNYEKSGKPTVSRKPTVSPDAPSLPAEGLEGVAEVKPKAKKSRKPTGRDSTPTPSLPEGEVAVDGVEEKPKAKRVRKPKVVASDATEAGVVEDSEAVPVEDKPKAKRVRKPKVVASDATETGVVEGVPVEGVPVEGTEAVPVEKPKAKNTRKPKASSEIGTESGVVEGVPVEDKPKAKKTRKPKASSEIGTETLPVDEADNMPKAKKSKKPLSNPDDIIHNLLNDIASSSE